MRERLRALRYALRGLYRCLVCGRPRALHTSRRLDRCDTTPLPIVITPAGRALAALDVADAAAVEVEAG